MNESTIKLQMLCNFVENNKELLREPIRHIDSFKLDWKSVCSDDECIFVPTVEIEFKNS